MTTPSRAGDRLFGKGRERIPNQAFKAMTLAMNLVDWFSNHSSRTFKKLGIKKGQVVVDYGCGPARYIRNASTAVGESGQVYAVDTHPLAIEKVNRKIQRFDLRNVIAIQARGYDSTIPSHAADLVFALDMFHMIERSTPFLGELYRITKPEGLLIIQDGHQAREETMHKIAEAGCWLVLDQNKSFVRCMPLN